MNTVGKSLMCIALSKVHAKLAPGWVLMSYLIKNEMILPAKSTLSLITMITFTFELTLPFQIYVRLNVLSTLIHFDPTLHFKRVYNFWPGA